MERVDLLLVANMLDPACRIDDPSALARASERQARVAFDLTGNPALSIPTSLSAAGLPLSAQLVAPMHAKDMLLRVYAALEGAGHGVSPPPVH